MRALIEVIQFELRYQLRSPFFLAAFSFVVNLGDPAYADKLGFGIGSRAAFEVIEPDGEDSEKRAGEMRLYDSNLERWAARHVQAWRVRS